MRLGARPVPALVLILAVGGHGACAQSPSARESRVPGLLRSGYWADMAGDAARIAVSPAGWKARDLARVAAVGGVTAAAGSQDEDTREWVLRERGATSEGAARIGEALGNSGYLLAGLCAGSVSGWLAGDERLERACLNGTRNLAIGAGLLNTAGKLLAHRHRPYAGDGAGAWDGPGFETESSRMSFPSGHACSAFSVAGAFAREYGSLRPIGILARAGAVLAAMSRVHDDKHWLSDVVAGSALGYFTAGFLGRPKGENEGRGPRFFFAGLSAGIWLEL